MIDDFYQLRFVSADKRKSPTSANAANKNIPKAGKKIKQQRVDSMKSSVRSKTIEKSLPNVAKKTWPEHTRKLNSSKRKDLTSKSGSTFAHKKGRNNSKMSSKAKSKMIESILLNITREAVRKAYPGTNQHANETMHRTFNPMKFVTKTQATFTRSFNKKVEENPRQRLRSSALSEWNRRNDKGAQNKQEMARRCKISAVCNALNNINNICAKRIDRDEKNPNTFLCFCWCSYDKGTDGRTYNVLCNCCGSPTNY